MDRSAFDKPSPSTAPSRVAIRSTPAQPIARARAPAAPAKAHPAMAPTPPTKRAYRDFDRPLAVLGSIVVVLAPGIFSGPFVHVFLGVMMIPSVIALALILWRTRPWTYLTVAILGAIFPVLTVATFGIPGGALENPANVSLFGAISLIVVGLLILEAGAIAGFVHGRRKADHASVRSGWRTARGVFTLLVAALFLGMVGAGALAAGKLGDTYGYDLAAPATLRLTTEEFEFRSKTPTVASDVLTEFVIENKDRELHTFTYILNGTVYSHDVYGGKTARFLALFPAPGTVKFWCDPHSEGAEDDSKDGMWGTLTVT